MAEAEKDKAEKFNEEMPLFSENFEEAANTVTAAEKNVKKKASDKMKKSGIIAKKTRTSTSKTVDDNTGRLGLTIGSYLQEARVKSDYSLSQVSMITKLNIHYIEAIERDDLNSAPPFIYVKAYVKKLCDLYKVDDIKAINLLESCNDDKPDKVLPETMLQDLEETKQVDEKEAKKIKYLARIITASVAVVVLVIVIIMLSSGGGENESSALPKNPQETKKMIQTNMEKLIVPQTLTPSELIVPGETGK